MIGDLLGYREHRDLETAFSDTDLKGHFRTTHKLYVGWRSKGCSEKISLGGGYYEFSAKDTFEYVWGMIVDYDDGLRKLMTRTNIPNEIGLDHNRVAELFALHVTANMPLPAKG